MKIEDNFGEIIDGSGLKVAILLPRFNESLGMELATNLVSYLMTHKVEKNDIEVFRLPGAMELPWCAQRIINEGEFDVIVALGVVIRGGTVHFDYVNRAVTDGLVEVSLKHDFPIVNGVLMVENIEQARDRIAVDQLDKAKDFAWAAVELGNFS